MAPSKQTMPLMANAFDRSCGTDGICNTTSNTVYDCVPPGKPSMCHVDAKDVPWIGVGPADSKTLSGFASLYFERKG
jgi:hypothetical protein